MVDYCRAGGLAVAVDELNDFGRQPCLEHDLDERVTSMRDVFGGFEDARVSAEERGKHLPRRDGHRKVERRNDAGDTDRSTKAHRPLVPHLTRHGVTEEPTSFRRGVVRGVDAFLYVAARLGERLSH